MPLSQLYGIRRASHKSSRADAGPNRGGLRSGAEPSARDRGGRRPTIASIEGRVTSAASRRRKITLRNVVAQVDRILVEDPGTRPFLRAYSDSQTFG